MLRVVLSVLLLALADPVSAAPITWTFAGTVRSVDTNGDVTSVLGSLGLAVGAPMNGTMRFESTTPDLRPEPESAYFGDAVQEYSVSFAGAPLTLLPDLVPGDATNPEHGIYVSSYASPPFSLFSPLVDLTDPTGQLSFLFAAHELTSHDPTRFDPGVLLVDPPALTSLDPFGPDDTSAGGFGTDFVIAGGNAATGINFFARIELSSLARAVPEPNSLVLLVLAAAFLRRACTHN